MKRGTALLSLLVVGTGLYFYQTNSNLKSNIDQWFAGLRYDSLDRDVKLDTVRKTSPQKAKPKPRERIPKKLKPGAFDRLDKYARNTPEKYSNRLQDLAAYLATPAQNDLEKARLAYTWIATHIRYDADAYNTGVYKDEFSAAAVLKRRTAVCEGYSTLFKELTRRMHLEVEKITGYAKGYGLKEAARFSDTNHAWNAVKINNEWQLIDVTWGSGYGFTHNKKLETKTRFDDYWFCVSPEEFIFSHLPESEDWQLTNPKITLRQFEAMPRLDDSFFKLGFNAEDAYKEVLSGAIKEFVSTYSTDFPVQAIDVPLNKVIAKGQEYALTLQSDYAEAIAIIDDGEWTYFKKENNRFSSNYIPKGNKLKIAVKINWYDNNFSTILEYEVDDVKI
ncbi:MAG TPA: transglutaminase domain-containing protein [Chryseolinea sp.]